MSAPICTVLIIEDFLLDRELYQRCLRTDLSCTYRFLAADSVKAALELCQTQKIDAILLDYLLPDADRLAFLETLQAQSDRHSPPVVMVTGQGDEMVAARAFKLGVEDYLVKQELTPELLQLTLRSAIENARLRLQLRQSEERFRTSIENLLDCFGIYSAVRDESGQITDFRIDYLNAAALESNQMTADDIGKLLCELLPAHRESGLFAEYCQLVETGKPLIKAEWIYSDTFGAQYLTRIYDLHASKLDDGFVASWRDVTARKQAELERQQLLTRERIVNQIMRQIRESLDLDQVLNTAVTEVRQFLKVDRAFIFRFNPDFSGKILVESVSEGWSSALNAQVEDAWFQETRGDRYLQGQVQSVEDIYQAGLSDCHVEMLAQFQIRANLVVPILQGENLWGLLVLNQCDRPRQWQPADVDLLQQLATQIGIAVHQAELYQQMQAELRENQQNEQRLRESEERLQLGVQVAGVALAKFDYGSNTVTLSPEAAALYSIPLDELVISRDRIHATFHPDEQAMLAQIIEQVLDPEGTGWFAREHRVVWQNGEVRWLNVQKQVFFDRSGESPRPEYAILAAIDITGRKQAEAERDRLLAAAQAAHAEAEAANRSKDEFVALVAHELRSPLNAVLGWAKLLQSRRLDESTTAQALDIITRNTYAQVQLIEDLLDVSRIGRGTLQLTLESVDLGDVVVTAVETVRPEAEAKRLRVEVVSEKTVPISGDFNRLQQVMLNLLTNAIKFTPEGGRVQVVLDHYNTQIRIQVIDSGKGISPDFLPHIFERFSQDQQNATTKQGLGLGLAIVQHLVKLHGGAIAVESLGEKQGATFTLLFPVLPDESASIKSESDFIEADSSPLSLAASLPLTGIQVLLVDDEPDILELTAFILEDAGATVQTATSAAAALELLTQFKPDILLSDIAMPGHNGYDLLQQIRSLYPQEQILAIAFTADSSHVRQEESLEAGFQHHFTKPMEPQQLITAILSLIQQGES